MHIRVAVALITDAQQKVLVTQRAPELSHGGFWELPGGKIEPWESPEIALLREVREEVGIDVLRYHYWGEIHHTYEHYQVTLYGYHVHHYRGEARCCESQTALRWLRGDELAEYEFPAANKPLLDWFIQKNSEPFLS